MQKKKKKENTSKFRKIFRKMEFTDQDFSIILIQSVIKRSSGGEISAWDHALKKQFWDQVNYQAW